MRLVLHQLLPRYLQLWREHDGRVRDVYAGFKSYLKRTIDEFVTGEGCSAVQSWDHISRWALHVYHTHTHIDSIHT